jgi:hypothetical protein
VQNLILYRMILISIGVIRQKLRFWGKLLGLWPSSDHNPCSDSLHNLCWVSSWLL